MICFYKVLASPAAAQYVSGIAVHWYTDQYLPSALLELTHQVFPEMFILATEACQGWAGPHDLGNWVKLERYAKDILDVSTHCRSLDHSTQASSTEACSGQVHQ